MVPGGPESPIGMSSVPPHSSSPAEAQWRDAQAGFDAALRGEVADAVDAVAVGLSDTFYRHMLADPLAAPFLDHAVVDARLHASMVRWLRGLFAPDVAAAEVLAVQRRTGEVHARIGVPMDLVHAGARVLKRALVSELARGALPRDTLALAVQYVYERMGVALEVMAGASASSADRHARTDEAYRLFFLSQDLKAERERQKSHLLEWAHEILMAGYWPVADSVPEQSPGAFGVWLHHKASILFDGAPELARIHACMAEIEERLQPALVASRGDPARGRDAVARFQQAIGEIKALLASMFDRSIAGDDGRDGVTRLLNRRYFPTVAKREIAYAQRQHGSFGIVLAEIDRFDELRNVLGHEAADTVLSAVADTLQDRVRAGDFVFRVGEAQFLLLLVEVNASQLPPLAEGLRQQVEAMQVRIPGLPGTGVTVCVGAAAFDGHPDYQRLLDRADAALQSARAGGVNRLAVDPG